MTGKRRAIEGCLLGTAAGDALGLAGEGLTRRRLACLFPDLSHPHFLGHRGMISDDTEHMCFVAQALIESAGETVTFTQALASRLKWWLLGAPAGIGWATLRAILKLWLGFLPGKSGVWSAGNGPAMRSALLGVCYGDSPERLRELVRASSRLTHTDPRAEAGALAVAVAASLAAGKTGNAYLPNLYWRTIKPMLGESDLRTLLRKATISAQAGGSTWNFAAGVGADKGVSGYVNQTVPVVIHAWLSFPDDYRSAVTAVIRCGGDTDTTAAIVGAIVGARVGKEGIPGEWLSSLAEWPRTVDWMCRLAGQLADMSETGAAQTPLSLPVVPLLARNSLFAVIVLAHGFRRLLPPY